MNSIDKKKKMAGLLFAVLLIIIYIVVLRLFHLPEAIRHYKVSSPDDITAYYTQEQTLTEVTFHTLYYTGVDYYRDNIKVGAYYYYEITDDTPKEHLFTSRYILVLTQTTTGQETLTDYTCKCRITDGDGRTDTVLSTLSDGGLIRYTDINQMFCNLIYSEVDYPAISILLTYIFLVLAAIGIILYLVLTLCPISLRTHPHRRI